MLKDRAPLRPAAPELGLGVVTLLLAGLTGATPFLSGDTPLRLVGLLLLVAGMLELLHSFRRVSPDAQQGASRSASFTLAMGFLVFLAPALVGSAVVLLLAAWFGLDGLRCLAELRRQWSRGQARFRPALAAAGNLATAGLLGLLWNASATWVVALAGALRILGAGWNMVTAPVHTLHDTSATFSDSLGLSEHPDAVRLAERLVDEERQRRPIDRGWIAALLMILFAIHIGRMEAEWTLVGLLGPFVAVLGDMLVALLIAFGVIGPTRLGLRRLGRPLERRGWSRLAAADRAHRPWTDRLLFRWLSRNLRLSIRAHQTWYSIPFALERGLQAGLPIVAVLVATVPIWGMSWYFDTENWAAGIYNSWAEQRTDTWRQAMTRAVRAASPSGASTELFDVDPAGLTGDFAFVVIGDTGEGDASQQALVPQLLRVGGAADTRFVVISSDVVYPTGAMKNYEANFWLPFHGIERPVYAIPGNHDWYDALEGFAATFLEAGAARATMRARIETDHRLTSTTDSRIAWLIEQAGRYRDAYRVPTGFQRAPFFQVQTAGFALIAVDTGVLRRVDPDQDAWLRAALERARGKFIMVVLGHPLYAGGQYQAERDEGFEALHHLLRAHEVGLVMAGDTHDLEMYVERYATAGGERVMHHVVNGGGGAYLSFGTALAWPARPALADWAFYPSTSSVVDKLDRHTPLWKWPFWVWTRRFGAWPFSAEGLSAAFDYNVAPFFQSFVEVRVERSAGRVRLIPHGVNGRLRWADLQASPSLRPADRGPEDLVEVALPMPR